ncbi:DUF305 domain-containing protein [Citricoccus sp. SGAir0253]|uniref:DUF305 domain-containing protein n=1 Tax=Citricoccus sp. SGAir0253 TaxID=2567881 RepID=UPI0010CD4113|nr:DUF305 domain-containing protein [Citricoccus sp. SGAir0253]QCU79121.1 DUF305 domain-containing protein [Citricoccus sp. SGAir0253]
MKKHTTPLAGLALAAALALAGCGGTDAGSDSGSETSSPAASATSSAPASEGSSGSGPASASGSASGAEEISAEHNDADVMFAQMMIPHHEQAVEMSEMLLAKEGVPAEVGDFAQRVIDAQGPEIDHMDAMLGAWGAERASDEEMGGMDHGSGDAGMSGMMSEEDMAALEQAEGTEAARLYLEQMTAHHEGAVEMAREQLDAGQNPQAQQLAQQVVDAQEAEIEEMRAMLRELPAS